MSHIIAIDLNPLEVEFDPEQVRDATELLFGTDLTGAAATEDRFKLRLQDAVMDAVASTISMWVVGDVDFTIRVEQPKVPAVPLVKAINTVPF